MNERDAIFALKNQVETAVLATVVEVKGSAYRRAGARMLLSGDGRSAGVINGGCLDADLHARAQVVLENGAAQLACYDTTSAQDIVFGLGLGCRGVVRILLEPVENLDFWRDGQYVAVQFVGDELGTRVIQDTNFERPQIIEDERGRAYIEKIEAPLPLVIFGAGADAAPLAEFSRALGWNTQVFDLRAPNPTRASYVASSHIAPEKLESLKVPQGAACVVMTHNFLHDLEVLKRVLPSDAMYIGVLGPRRRADELLDKMDTETLLPPIEPTESQLERIYAPVGLDLGAETPEEIALSIIAEIQMVRRQKSGQSLKGRGSIH